MANLQKQNYTYLLTAVISVDTRKIVGQRCSKKMAKVVWVEYMTENAGDGIIKSCMPSVPSQNFCTGNSPCNEVFLVNLHLGKSDSKWQKE